MNGVLILGNQLFDPLNFARLGINPKNTIFFLREDRELCTYYRFHKHKIIFFFGAMRSYRDELESNGYTVHYEELNPARKKTSYEEALLEFLKTQNISNLFVFEIEDKFFEKRISQSVKKLGIHLNIWQSPMFLTSRAEFKDYIKSHKKPLMRTFYQLQRKNLQILMEKDQPVGGRWSFDTENRLALPKDKTPPLLPSFKVDSKLEKVIGLVNNEFSDHPGRGEDFWLPVRRSGARRFLKSFVQDRLKEFGPYEDAIPQHSDFVYHSVLSPFLNVGLLTPSEIIQEVLKSAQAYKIPLSSLEGFVRQVVGWREFIRGVYQNFSDTQETTNFWGHRNRLKEVWYQGKTGIPPLDRTLQKVIQLGYAHHIERLMVIGSLMVLLEVDPKEAHRWFMEMFIDSSDWVMGPNVYGMALFSDGGIFATKPYICGSNYLRKMSGEKQNSWCLGVDGLYWSFIKKHQDFFLKNPRLSVAVKTLKKMPEERMRSLEAAAGELRNRLVETVCQ